MIRALLHAIWHKPAVMDGPTGAVILTCSRRFWWIAGRKTRIWFIPFAGAMPEELHSGAELEARIEAENHRWRPAP